MAEDDIYGNREKYERYVARIERLSVPIAARERRGTRKYWCKNPDNVAHFTRLLPVFEARDLSYTRRIRLFRTLLLICYATEKQLSQCTREDVDRIVGFAHSTLPAAKSKRDFIVDLKFLWRTLLPEKDGQGRPDETVMPYVVRHLSSKIDRSKEKLRNEKLSLDDVERLLQSFSTDKRLQAFFALSLDSLRRPQELLYVRIRDVELHDNHAKIWIASHGKEGPGLAQCIDSFPYLVAWYNEHPLRHDKDAFLFINLGDRGRHGQLTPGSINKHLREKLRLLGISKRITCYSFKRNGVTIRRLRGDSDVSIQRAAGWTSTRQIRTYDLSNAEDAFKIELVKRGLLQDKAYEQFRPMSKSCQFCGQVNGMAEAICAKCKRPLDREQLEQEITSRENAIQQEREEQERLRSELSQLRSEFSRINAFMNRLVDTSPELLEAMAQAAVSNQSRRANGKPPHHDH